MFGDEGYVDLKDSSYGMDEHKPGNDCVWKVSGERNQELSLESWGIDLL